MRLIDADKLKYKTLAEVNGRLNHVLTAEEINNAPTVESYKEKYDNLKEAYRLLSEAYEHEVTKEERPQGEWVRMALDNKTIVYCSECHLHYEYPFNYCPNCGAQMAIGGEI